jgi:hypothetical protein
MAKEDYKASETPAPSAPQVIPSSDGQPISEKPGTVIVSHEKKDGSKVMLTVITN